MGEFVIPTSATRFVCVQSDGVFIRQTALRRYKPDVAFALAGQLRFCGYFQTFDFAWFHSVLSVLAFMRRLTHNGFTEGQREQSRFGFQNALSVVQAIGRVFSIFGHLIMPLFKVEPRVCPKCKSPYWNKPNGQRRPHKEARLYGRERKRTVQRITRRLTGFIVRVNSIGPKHVQENQAKGERRSAEECWN